jgi:hypothetical protein
MILAYLVISFNLSPEISKTLALLDLDSGQKQQELFLDSLKAEPLVQKFVQQHRMLPWKNRIWYPSNGPTVIDIDWQAKCHLSVTWGEYINPGRSGSWLAAQRIRWECLRSSSEFFKDTRVNDRELTTHPITRSEFVSTVKQLLVPVE